MKRCSSEKGFLGLAREEYPLSKHRALVVPFGFESHEELNCSLAPQAIIGASKEINLFDERYGCCPYQQIHISTLKEISPRKKSRHALLQLQQWQETLCLNEEFSLTLGGDSGLVLQAVAPWFIYNKNLAFIHLGAHTDVLYDLSIQYPEQLILGFGTRNITESVYQLTRSADSQLSFYQARDKNNWDWQLVKTLLTNKSIFLSISVDCFDPSLFPATPYAEPGGLMWDEVIHSIERLANMAPIIGASLCDFSPMDTTPAYDLFVAKLAYRLLATVFLGACASR